jgi:hypothetical protein
MIQRLDLDQRRIVLRLCVKGDDRDTFIELRFWYVDEPTFRVLRDDMRRLRWWTTPRRGMLLGSMKSWEAFRGDLEERFARIRHDRGGLRARVWFWHQVVISLGSLIMSWLTNVLRRRVSGYDSLENITRSL